MKEKENEQVEEKQQKKEVPPPKDPWAELLFGRKVKRHPTQEEKEQTDINVNETKKGESKQNNPFSWI
ncbi:hypothetical protein [Salipaludibacillus daqingensis]|uniref:hypothetical protein n=1 Tax=Salipaludibacillus daqingensis TaxID=3041001 RepID=UPI0024771A5B|nr:hypothetical protein [Salipaludibacillus daqingensis]